MFSTFATKDTFTVVGIEKEFEFQESSKIIPEMVHEVLGRKSEIKNVQGVASYGITTKVSDTKMTYIYAVNVSKVEDLPVGMVSKEIPSQEYAVFIHKGPITNIKETYDYIFSKWLKENDVETIQAPSFEYYGEKFIPYGDKIADSIIEINLPIKKK